MRILSAHRAVIDGIIEFHEGRIIGTAGDSVLAEFGSPVEAVRCAVEIQDALKTRNNSLPEAQRMQFRIGVNLGDVMEKGADLLGDGVNVAARLESIAEPGGICVSSSVYDQIAGKLDLSFVNIGAQNLKNIDRPIQAYRVDREGGGSGIARGARPAAATWLAGALAVVGVAAALAWYFDALPLSRETGRAGMPSPAAEERAKLEGELAKARADAEQARQRAEAESAAAAQAKRALEEQRVAEARARAEAEIARARADAEGTRRKADAELARAQVEAESTRRKADVELARAAEERRVAEAEVKAAAAKPPVLARSVPVTTEAPGRLEGAWKAVIACEAFEGSGPFTEALPISTSGDAFVVQRGAQGQPGSYQLRGAPDKDGWLQLLGSGIAGLPQYYGKPYPAAFNGRFVGDRYEGSGGLGRRKCRLTISRGP